MRRVVAVASATAAGLSLHSVVNWRLLRAPSDRPGAAASRPSVSVLLPARDEAARIGPAVVSVLAQEGVDLELLVLDDCSTDGTAAVARAAIGDDPRGRVLPGAPLPDGWLGKPHACWQLAERARGDVLAFLDADVVLELGGLAMAVDLLDHGGLDIVSPCPRQLAGGVAERLVQPLLQWSWATFLPLWLAERSRAPSLTAANGQLLVCHAAAYRAAGGHAAVRGAVLEDVALARRGKAAGLAVAMADGTAVATCRMYGGWAELREGYAKSLWAAFGSPAGAAAVLALLAFLYVLPPAAALLGLRRRDGRLAATGAAGYLAAAAGRAAVARRTGGRPADAVWHPASVVVLGWLTAASLRRRRRGALSWKGRAVAP